jgi:hypothetical protein
MQGIILKFHLLVLLSLTMGAANGYSRGGYSTAGGVEGFRRTLQESSRCGEYMVEWSNPANDQDLPAEERLLIRSTGGQQILEIVTKAWDSYTLDVLWCEDILGDGLPAIAYRTYSAAPTAAGMPLWYPSSGLLAGFLGQNWETNTTSPLNSSTIQGLLNW